MKKLETMNTIIDRGAVKFNSPISYSIKGKVTNEVISEIKIQKGPVKEEEGLNGIFIEDLLLICIDQLEHFQISEYACEENERTLHHLKCALDTTRARQYERLMRGVQGKMSK